MNENNDGVEPAGRIADPLKNCMHCLDGNEVQSLRCMQCLRRPGVPELVDNWRHDAAATAREKERIAAEATAHVGSKLGTES